MYIHTIDEKIPNIISINIAIVDNCGEINTDNIYMINIITVPNSMIQNSFVSSKHNL